MKIQVIGYNETQKFNTSFEVEYTTFNKPNSLDEYDINIINLQNELIWRNSSITNSSINQLSDLKSLNIMIANSSKSKKIIALPQNYDFKFNYATTGYSSSDYRNTIQLKDMLYQLTDGILPALTPINFKNNIFYENTKTVCEDEVFSASFYFSNRWETLTVSSKSEKATTILIANVVFTTLNIPGKNTNLDKFLSAIHLIKNQEEIPNWVHDFEFLDDVKQKTLVKEKNKKIENLKQEIENAENKISSNLEFKSVLVYSGDELVKVVIKMLDDMLGANTSDFIDIHKEDFLLRTKEKIFIGEIKGINTNVKNANVSQIDTRYNEYIDDNPEDKNKLKALLVVNPWRKTPVNDRVNIHQDQIDIALRNKSLIITTQTLLKIYEKFLQNKIDSSTIETILFTKIGLLTEEDF